MPSLIHRQELWSDYAKSTIICIQEGRIVYGYGSEIGALRLYYRMKTGRVGFDREKGLWYYADR